mmetsp:Transcript_2746/g.8223  ORF Transcript_2746/g.8223 Transcript_2746/m.8223 type:complete len:290 (+) Transcript_2746:561-1430(+)
MFCSLHRPQNTGDVCVLLHGCSVQDNRRRRVFPLQHVSQSEHGPTITRRPWCDIHARFLIACAGHAGQHLVAQPLHLDAIKKVAPRPRLCGLDRHVRGIRVHQGLLNAPLQRVLGEFGGILQPPELLVCQVDEDPDKVSLGQEHVPLDVLQVPENVLLIFDDPEKCLVHHNPGLMYQLLQDHQALRGRILGPDLRQLSSMLQLPQSLIPFHLIVTVPAQKVHSLSHIQHISCQAFIEDLGLRRKVDSKPLLPVVIRQIPRCSQLFNHKRPLGLRGKHATRRMHVICSIR